ncbi:MAG: hypothetical protein QNJ97_05460 [Myxococcota bacterium]|nr:hypothetical protein [Myxococcota bacterium]
MKSLKKVVCVGVAVVALISCQRTAEQEFKDALPDHQDLRVIMGKNDINTSTALTARVDDCPECCIDEVDGSYVDSDIYKMTRSAIWHVNGSLVTIYLWLGLIVSSPYSETIEDGYIWGPWDDTDVDPLTRLQYRFVMIESGEDAFDYWLETKEINDDAGEWIAFVTGRVEPSDVPHKGMGTMEVNFDVLHELDSAHPVQQHGRIVYDFDVRQINPTKAAPNTVAVHFYDFWDSEDLDGETPVPFEANYFYERYENLAGKFQFTASADITGPDDAPDEIEEVITVASNWTEMGEGIGIAQVSGGSASTLHIADYTLTECWADTTGLYYETYDRVAITFTNGTDPLEEIHCGELAHCPIID